MTLRYFTDQAMTQKIENTDTDIKLITQQLNKTSARNKKQSASLISTFIMFLTLSLLITQLHEFSILAVIKNQIHALLLRKLCNKEMSQQHHKNDQSRQIKNREKDKN